MLGKYLPSHPRPLHEYLTDVLKPKSKPSYDVECGHGAGSAVLNEIRIFRALGVPQGDAL